MSSGGLQFTGPVAGRSATPRVPGGPTGRPDGRLGPLPGRLAGGRLGPGRSAPGRSARRRSGGFASSPLAGADLTPYRHRAAQLATLLESDRSHPRPGAHPGPGVERPGPGVGPASPPLPGDLGRRLGLVRVGVEALVADLESVDAAEEEVRPLRQLVVELGRVVAGAGSGPLVLERVREWALAVLGAFAAPDGRGGEAQSRPAEREPGRGQRFWKR
jgi:hypothetical protein